MNKYIHLLYRRYILNLIVFTWVLFASVTPVWAFGAWANTQNWPEAPTWGDHAWSNLSDKVRWTTYYQWNESAASALHNYDNRTIELELYNPGATTDCDQLTPITYYEGGGDWIYFWLSFNGCGSSFLVEDNKFYLKEYNIVAYTWYWLTLDAQKVGGNPLPDDINEVNVSMGISTWLNDTWLGKQQYNRYYHDAGSQP